MKKRRLIKPIIAAALVCLVALLIIVILNISPLPFSNTGVPAGFFSYSDISALSFERPDGSKMRLSELNGKTVVLVYFTTWCPLCKEGLSRINELAATVADEDAVLLLINKFDERENRDHVLSFIENNGIDVESLFDTDAFVYNKIGLSGLPTTLVADPQGRLVSICPGEIPQTHKLVSLVRDGKNGKTAALLAFLQNSMTNDDGGIRTTFDDGDGSLPSGADVLSESLGLMMQYAAETQSRALFESAYSFVQTHSAGSALTAWVTSATGASKVNAVVDDLRIFRALHAANEIWGGYDEDLKALSEALYQHCTNNRQLVDFYDFDAGMEAKRLTLCYADFKALALLCEQDSRWQTVYSNSLNQVEGGRISEDFPLYRSYYDYNDQRYAVTDLNMAEALLTLLHLSEAQKLPSETYEWLRARVMEGAVHIRYDQYGQPTADGRMVSTAVYALCAQIGLSEQDEEMVQKSLALMSAQRIHDASSPFNGAFGNPDGSGIYSFDQLMALLAYSRMEGEA